MRKKKNRFLLFCCSFVPGAGELYLGFMNMGLSLLMSFAILVVIVGFTEMGILAFLPFVLWVYSFFHANNLGGLSDEEFYRMEDTFLFGLSQKEMESIRESLSSRYRKVAAIVLIVLGVSMLWNVVVGYIRYFVGYDFYYQYIAHYVNGITKEVPQLILSIVIIACGIKLIRGKKIELDRMEEKDENVGSGMRMNGGMDSGMGGSSGMGMNGNENADSHSSNDQNWR